MNNHLAVTKGLIPAVTREEKDALIRHLKTRLSEATDLLIRATFFGDPNWGKWKEDVDKFLQAIE